MAVDYLRLSTIGSSGADRTRRHGSCRTEADEVLRISDRFYILSTSARIDDRTRVLKHGDAFAVFDRFGDVQGAGTGELGV